MSREILTNPEIDNMLQAGAVVAIGVSGGKDSDTLAIALNAYLNEIGHPKEKRVLIHSDLGLIEWPESAPWCQKLSEFTGIPLITVHRQAGGMIERWESRWKANWNRYLNLESLKVILPWSTAAMRFCTSELKTDIICRELRKRFPEGPILSATGIRAEESPNRAKAPIWSPQKKLTKKAHLGFNWNPILKWTLKEVFALHKEVGFPLHPGYTQFGASRISCSLCILSTVNDQTAALRQPANHPTYKRLCELELLSGFAFQKNRWLCDLDTDLRERLLPGSQQTLLAAKEICRTRELLEETLPKHALFIAGKPWPSQKLTKEDAERITLVRNSILPLYGVYKIEDPEWIQTSINERVQINNPSPEDEPQMRLL